MLTPDDHEHLRTRVASLAQQLRWLVGADGNKYMPDVFGLIFLRNLSLRIEVRQESLPADGPRQVEVTTTSSQSMVNDRSLPKLARWEQLRAAVAAGRPHLGSRINKAMATVEHAIPSLKGALPKKYTYATLADEELGTLIELIDDMTSEAEPVAAQMVLQELCDFLLEEFAKPLTWRDSSFDTPSVVNRVLVSMLNPRLVAQNGGKVSVYDPCCGVGGTLLRAAQHLTAGGLDLEDVAVYGQEVDRSICQLCRLYLEIYGVDSRGVVHQGSGTFYRDAWSEKHFDYVLAQPPLYMRDWGADKLRGDPRWQFGVPPRKPADYAWLQHVLYHLAPNGVAGVVLGNFSTTAGSAEELAIRRHLVENDLVDCVVALPGQLYRTTQSAASLWILTRNKRGGQYRDRQREVLFINARDFGEICGLYPVLRTLPEADIDRLARTYHSWRGDEGAKTYVDRENLCKSVSTDEIRQRSYGLVPEWYTGRILATEDSVSGLRQSEETHSPPTGRRVRSEIFPTGERSEMEESHHAGA